MTPTIHWRSFCHRLQIAILFLLPATTLADLYVSGTVVDSNGQPIKGAQIIFDRAESQSGASVVTVFSTTDGSFSFPQSFPETSEDPLSIYARALGYEQLSSNRTYTNTGQSLLKLTLIMELTENQVNVAPASAWLGRIEERADQSAFVMNCIDCHQVPGPEVRRYAASIDDLQASDPHDARLQSWNSIVKYMNYLSSWEFSRGGRAEEEQIDAQAVYSVDNGSEVAALLADIFDDRLDYISDYQWGAPLIAGPDTVIWEYEVPHPNAIREALMLGDPATLWVADVASNNMITIDVSSGEQTLHEVPTDQLMSPHSMHPGADGSLWITPLFNSIVAQKNISSGEWKTWKLLTDDGKSPGIHDLSFSFDHTLMTDDDGNIWFSDIGNNSVGYFSPTEGNSKVWPAPASPGRPGRTALYGLSMTSDASEVWYSQLGNGTFGGFNIEQKQYIGPFQLPDVNAGPRRISIDDNDILYLALYGSGQLAAFDTRRREMIKIYDLPDTASSPYSTTWDPVRRVIWIATSNGDVIYRFDPATEEFGVLPLPRQQAFLRMIDVDPDTGVLITSYANIVDIVQGPRMALIIDPGDGAYPVQFSPQASKGRR